MNFPLLQTKPSFYVKTYHGRKLSQRLNLNVRFDWLNTEICVTLLHENAADGGYTKKFVARNVAEVGRDSTAAILRATNFGVDTRCNSAIARNIAPCIRTFSIYTLSDLGVLGNLIGWLSLANEHYSPPTE